MRRIRFAVLLFIVAHFLGSNAGAVTPTEYVAADPALKLELIDQSPNESFLSIRCDGMGRLFVGGREAVFRYDPDDKGGYKPRVELYRFPPHSWAYDLEIRGSDLYVLTMNALYVFPNGAVETKGLTPKRLLWGVPAGHVHQCFHGLAWGPEGDLYISMGDPLWYYGDFDRPDHWGHWTFFTPDAKSEIGWKQNPYNGVGAVFRIHPDGTGFQTVATGLRNSCGLVFDSRFNLFTNDNDHESLPHAYVPGRLNHVVPNAYFAWPRGWMPHITPERADLLDTMTTGLGRAVPVGQSYYDDNYLGEEYRHNLLVARWCTRAVTRYPLQPSGATFHCEEKPLIVGKDLARPVGVSVGRGGRAFVAVSFMANNEGSPIYRSELAMLTRKDDPSTHPFDELDVVRASTDKLLSELQRRENWSIRQLIMVELNRRGKEAGRLALEQLRKSPDVPHRSLLLWIAASTCRDGVDPPFAQFMKQLLERKSANRSDAEFELQTLRVYGEFLSRHEPLRTLFEKRFEELTKQAKKTVEDAGGQNADSRRVTNAQLQHAGLLAMFRQSGTLVPSVVANYATNDDRYLRHAATRLMADRWDATKLSEYSDASDPSVRLAAVLAAGFRLTLVQPDQKLDDSLPLAVWRSPEEAYLIPYANEGSKTDLRTFGRAGTYTVAEHWKASKHSDDQESLFSLLLKRLDDGEESVRLQSAHFLSMLNDPRSEPKVVTVLRNNEQRRLQLAELVNPDKAWVAGPFADGDQGFNAIHQPEKSAIDLSQKMNSEGRSIEWKQSPRGPRYFDFRQAFGNVAHTSSYAYFRLESSRKQQLMLLVGSDDGIKVWHNGRNIFTNDISRAALPLQDIIYVDLEPGSNDLLFRVRNLTGETGLYVHYRSLTKLPVVLPEPIGADSLGERLKSATTSGNAPIDPTFLSVNWREAAEKGDVSRGKKLFSAEGLGCAKCHAIRADEPVTGGPSLADASRRFTIPHLVESVLVPSKMVSPVFKATLVTTKDGKQSSGLVIGETGEKVELLLPDAKRVTIPKAEVEEMKLQDVSPMPAGLVKHPDELRDLLAYLLDAMKAP